MTVWWFCNRYEDQEAVAYRSRITPIDWLDGERFLYPNDFRILLRFFLTVFDWLCSHHLDLGVYDALQKKYLKTLMFCICESVEGPMIEEYSCKFWRDGWLAFLLKSVVCCWIIRLIESAQLSVLICMNHPLLILMKCLYYCSQFQLFGFW